MRLHRNAKLAVAARRLLVDRVRTQGWTVTRTAEAELSQDWVAKAPAIAVLAAVYESTGRM